MKGIFYFLTLTISLFLSRNCFAQYPTYTLSADNLHFNKYTNQIEWDIYILHTNPPTAFEYAGGQYVFDFDSGLIVDGGALTFSIVGSDLPANVIPKNPTVYLTGGQHQLRLAVNIPPGPGNGYIMTNNQNSNGGRGTLLARVRLTTTTYFQTVFYDPDVLWRNNPFNPSTKLYAYVGTTFTEITTPDTHSADVNFPGHTGQFAVAMLSYSPGYGSTVVSSPLEFKWSSLNPLYKLDISTDYQFSNIIYSNSSITDTFHTVQGLSASTKYYWKVSSYINGLNCFCGNSSISTFKTNAGISTGIRVIPEGLYNSSINLLNRKEIFTAYLRDVNSPFTLRDSAESIIDSVNFTGLFTFSNAPSGTYYIVVKNINGIETWSKTNGEVLNTGNNGTYDFTSSSSQAYGNNLTLKGTKYCIYSGDVNQDGAVDLTDISVIDNDAYNFITGFNAADLNGDDIVDLSDYTIADNNAFNFVSVVRP